MPEGLSHLHWLCKQHCPIMPAGILFRVEHYPSERSKGTKDYQHFDWHKMYFIFSSAVSSHGVRALIFYQIWPVRASNINKVDDVCPLQIPYHILSIQARLTQNVYDDSPMLNWWGEEVYARTWPHIEDENVAADEVDFEIHSWHNADGFMQSFGTSLARSNRWFTMCKVFDRSM